MVDILFEENKTFGDLVNKKSKKKQRQNRLKVLRTLQGKHALKRKLPQ
jgi:hypothetical protein